MKNIQQSLYVDPTLKLPWYQEFDLLLSKIPVYHSQKSIPLEISKQYRSIGKSLYDQQRSIYQNGAYRFHGISKQDIDWYETIKTGGTKKDQLAAMTLMISTFPVYHVDELLKLLELLSPNNHSNRKEYTLDVLSSIFHLFLTSTDNPNSILPPNRKLKCMEHRYQISSSNEEHKNLLIFCWFIEDIFCRAYAEVVSVLKTLLHDDLTYIKHRALDMATQCLISNPEQEQYLLSIIIDKFADSNNQTCSKVIQSLSKVVESHSNMIPVIVDNVCEFVFGGLTKSNKSTHFSYYSIIFLTRIPMNIEQSSETYSKLMAYYLKMLHHFSLETGQSTTNPLGTEKIIAYLFKGIKKILPRVDLEMQSLKDEISSIYRLIEKGSNWNMSLQALCLLFNVTKLSGGNELLKFLDTFYSMILNENIQSSSLMKQFNFLQLSRKIILMLVERNSTKGKSSSPWYIVHRLMQVGIIFREVPFICYTLGILIECLNISQYFRQIVISTIDEKERPLIFDLLMNHYHPSVSKLASNAIKAMRLNKVNQDEKIEGMDLESFVQFESLSTSKFLERFSKTSNSKKKSDNDTKKEKISKKMKHRSSKKMSRYSDNSMNENDGSIESS